MSSFCRPFLLTFRAKSLVRKRKQTAPPSLHSASVIDNSSLVIVKK